VGERLEEVRLEPLQRSGHSRSTTRISITLEISILKEVHRNGEEPQLDRPRHTPDVAATQMAPAVPSYTLEVAGAIDSVPPHLRLTGQVAPSDGVVRCSGDGHECAADHRED